jgi:hypothetical protein
VKREEGIVAIATMMHDNRIDEDTLCSGDDSGESSGFVLFFLVSVHYTLLWIRWRNSGANTGNAMILKNNL